MPTLATLTPQPHAAAMPELTRRCRALALTAGVNDTPLPELQVIRADEPTDILPTVYEPCLCVVLQGRKQTELGQERYLYQPGHFLVVSLTLATRARIIDASPTQPYLCLRVALDLGVIASQLATAEVVREPARDGRGLFLAPMNAPLADSLLRLLQALDQPGELAVMAPLLLQEVQYRVLVGPMGQQLARLVETGGHAQRVARAVEHLKRHYEQPLRIADLAAHAHMSPSSLHHRFKELTAMTPLQFQKQLRLHEARRLMLGEGLAAATAGHRVGYASPSQFSRDYRQLFGAPPRQSVQAVIGGAR